MEPESEYNKSEKEMMQRWDEDRRRGKLFGGILIVVIGTLFLARELGAIIPYWIFSWKMILVAVGIFIGFKHSFRNFTWLIPIIIGGAFLIQDIYPEMPLTNYLWPIGIIAVGLLVIFKPRRNFRNHHWHKHWEHKNWKENRYEGNDVSSAEAYSEINSVFGKVKRNIISKDFKGSEVNVVFGSAEINLSQADITGPTVIELNNVFGGTRLIVPSHWEVRSELNAVMGGVEDKRSLYKDVIGDPAKVLILKGDVVFGGVDILSF